jgi:2-methylisocitrate lyase-like PEP mutase family enzyme
LYSVEEACARMRAARHAIDGTGGDTLLVGRAEGLLVGQPSLDEIIARLVAYSNAGADCLYAPGIHTREQIASVVNAVAPKPVNLLVGGVSALTMAEIANLGVRRVSVGGALARTAWGAFMRAADQLAEYGRFDGFAQSAKGSDLNQFFGEDRGRGRGRNHSSYGTNL